MAVVAEINRQIRKIVRQALDDKKSGAWLEKQVRNLLSDPAWESEFREEAIDTARRQLTFMQDVTGLTMTERTKLTQVLEAAGNQFAYIKGELNKDVLQEVIGGLKSDSTKMEIQNRIEAKLGKFGNYAESITNTAIKGFDGMHTLENAKKAGINKLKMVGPPPERQWCRDHIGETHTIEEWQAMDNGQDLPVVPYCGGYRCRHKLITVVS